MDPDSWGDILTLILCLAGAAYCASAEIAFASLDLFRLQELVDDGDRRALKAKYVVDNFDRALVTILIGNNITHIAFAAVATAMAVELFGLGAVALVTLLSTILVFFFSELLPKSYAKGSFNYALAIAPSLYWLMQIFRPLSFIFSGISEFISRLFKGKEEPDISEEEFRNIVKAVTEEGSLGEQKEQLLNSALAFDNLLVQDAYQPLEKLDSINLDDSLDNIFHHIKSSSYSRLPVYQGKENHIIGIINAKSFLKAYITGEHINLREQMYEPHKVSFEMPIDKLLTQMSSQRSHICLVVDDLGRTRGIITLEDILEELVGEIWDETDLQTSQAVRLSGQNKQLGKSGRGA